MNWFPVVVGVNLGLIVANAILAIRLRIATYKAEDRESQQLAPTLKTGVTFPMLQPVSGEIIPFYIERIDHTPHGTLVSLRDEASAQMRLERYYYPQTGGVVSAAAIFDASAMRSSNQFAWYANPNDETGED